jgi:hypothetical protein
MRVYIAGPYTNGDVGWNVSNAITAAHTLMNHGHHPYVPHLFHFMHINHARSYEDWLELDLVYLSVCDVMIRLEGDSPGADKEEKFAKSAGIEVFRSVVQFLEIQREREKAQAGGDQ